MRRRPPPHRHLTDEERTTLRRAVWAIRAQCEADDPEFVAALNIVKELPIPEETRIALHAYRCYGGEWFVDDALRVKGKLIALLNDDVWQQPV